MDAGNLPPLFLAYIGDAVYEVYVRTKLLSKKLTPIWKLHKKVTRYVCGQQDAALRQIEPRLSARNRYCTAWPEYKKPGAEKCGYYRISPGYRFWHCAVGSI